MGKIIIKKKIGKSELSFMEDASDVKQALFDAAFYATTPDQCTICGGEEVTLDSNKTQEGYLYVKVRCLNEKCKAQATLGTYRDESGCFWKAFEIYEPKEDSSSDGPAEAKEVKKPTKKSKEEDFDF